MRLQQLVGTIRRTGKNAAACVCTGVLLVASSAGGQACPCAKRELASVVGQADVIFVGRPLAATTEAASVDGKRTADLQVRLAFDVALVLKGSTTRATTVVTPAGPCGAGFVMGGDYLVVGTKQGSGIVTDACQGNVGGVEAIRARATAIRATLAAPPTEGPTAVP